jgi:hypothetical protein
MPVSAGNREHVTDYGAMSGVTVIATAPITTGGMTLRRMRSKLVGDAEP